MKTLMEYSGQAIARHMPFVRGRTVALHVQNAPHTLTAGVDELARILHTIADPDRQHLQVLDVCNRGADHVRYGA
ncbi:hypothetical protein CBA19CS11_20485 [Caballeronia novacaledonica]|uniref:hypothetical protein n=1 Tax=Caballeronia novacaledonica TaxID=1544861 RepID=UPI001EE31EFA|nr:hypothetical protein [Caballeronia novacaledonica]GJH11257.1 hypothetical protein CBA19CS11_20485 [Caballeronia novacaledonica]